MMIEIRFVGTMPKEGNAPDTCDDRYAVRQISPGVCLAAIGDGASSTLYSGVWAELLTKGFVAQESGAKLLDLAPLRQAWFQEVMRQPLLWHQQEQVSQGATAAFLGVAIDGNTWSAVAVGDCNLFQVREEALIAAFPAASAADMDTFPRLLQTHGQEVMPTEIAATGNLHLGDSLFLMTDALSAWFLRETEAGRAPSRWLHDVRDTATLQKRVQELRDAGRLQNDDVALIHLAFV